MKKSKRHHIWLLLSQFLLCAACSKYLDKIPANNVATPQSLKDLQALLDDANLMNYFTTPSLGEVASDDYFLTKQLYDARPDFYKKSYTWQPYEYTAPNDWSQAYAPVYVSNFCLDYLDKIPLTELNKEDWHNVKGSAHFYRAFYFLNLSWVYCNAYDAVTSKSDLGIVLRRTSDFNSPSSRSNVEESYQQVIADIRIAIPYLPDLPRHPLRPSKCAAYGLMARTYLSIRKYDSANMYANLCLNIQNRLLNYSDAAVNQGAFVPFRPFNPEIIFFTTMNANPNISKFAANVDTTLVASYTPVDLRRKVFFWPNGKYVRFKGSYDGAQFFSGLAVDEVYLINAECLARSGKSQEACNSLNRLLLARYAPGTFAGYEISEKDQLLKIILSERRKELVMRGLRWMDIKRLNKENADIRPVRIVGAETYTIIPNSNRYALPLPKDIIDRTNMPQNPI